MERLRWEIEGCAQLLLVLAAARCIAARRITPDTWRPWLVLAASLLFAVVRRWVRIGPEAFGLEPESKLFETCTLLLVATLQFLAFGELKRRQIVDRQAHSDLEGRMLELAGQLRNLHAGVSDESPADLSALEPGRGPGPGDAGGPRPAGLGI